MAKRSTLTDFGKTIALAIVTIIAAVVIGLSMISTANSEGHNFGSTSPDAGNH